MRTIRDFKREEILALDHESLETETRKLLAVDGVAQLPPSPEPPPELSCKPSQPAYTINASELVFADEAEAQRILSILNDARRYTTFYHGGRYEYGGPQGIKACDTQLSLTTSKHFTTKEYDAYRVELEAHRRKKKEYEADSKKYEEARKGQEDVRQEVDRIVERAHREQRLEDEFNRRLNEYLEIAGGDRDLAWKFLTKAFSQYDDAEWLRVGGYDYDPNQVVEECAMPVDNGDGTVGEEIPLLDDGDTKDLSEVAEEEIKDTLPEA